LPKLLLMLLAACALLVPLLAFLLGWVLRPLEAIVLSFGTTRFANPAVYDSDAAEFTAEHCREYFRDGATVVRGALQPEVIDAMLKDFLSRHGPNEYINGLWMESAVLRDIFFFSKLASLAAQIYSCEGSETAADRPPVLLYRAHIGGRSSGWHYDTSDCNNGDFPANYTAHSLPRMVLPLVHLEQRHDILPGTVIYNQSVYSAGMEDSERARYWRGALRSYRLSEEHFDYVNVSELPPLAAMPAGHRASDAYLVEPRLAVGDMMVLSPCTIHRAPMPFRDGLTLALTFAPASAVLNGRYGHGRGDCWHGLEVGAPLRGDCFLQVHPRAGEHWTNRKKVVVQKIRMSSII